MKPAQVRFYADADILGLGKIIAAIRSDVTYPGDSGATIHKRVRPPCLILTPREKDTLWLPKVAAQDWLILTRDSKIQQHRAELDAVISNGGKMVALSSSDASSTWTQLEVLMTQWREIEKLVELPGPFIYTVTRASLKKVA